MFFSLGNKRKTQSRVYKKRIWEAWEYGLGCVGQGEAKGTHLAGAHSFTHLCFYSWTHGANEDCVWCWKFRVGGQALPPLSTRAQSLGGRRQTGWHSGLTPCLWPWHLPRPYHLAHGVCLRVRNYLHVTQTPPESRESHWYLLGPTADTCNTKQNQVKEKQLDPGS